MTLVPGGGDIEKISRTWFALILALVVVACGDFFCEIHPGQMQGTIQVTEG